VLHGGASCTARHAWVDLSAEAALAVFNLWSPGIAISSH